MKTDRNQPPKAVRTPDFDNLLDVLLRRQPKRPTLFEFFLNERLFNRMAPDIPANPGDPRAHIRRSFAVFQRLGYDYTTVIVPGFSFSEGKVIRRQKKSVSLNDEQSLVAFVVQAGQAMRQPGNGVALATAGRVLDEVVVPYALAGGGSNSHFDRTVPQSRIPV